MKNGRVFENNDLFWFLKREMSNLKFLVNEL